MNEMDRQRLWFRSFDARSARCLHLFVFPYAGGGAAAFRTWSEKLPSSIELHLVQLAGRGSRFCEAPVTRGVEIVEAISQAIASMDDAPFVLFGHSMGSILAFEVARQLRRTGYRDPSALIVSGRCAPQVRSRTPLLAHLRGADLVRRLAELYGSIPPEVLDDDALVKLMARVLEGDLCVVEHYEYVAEMPLDCPIAAFGGQADPWVTQVELDVWREQTRSDFFTEQYVGDHFYFRLAESERQLLKRVQQICASVGER